MQTKKTQNSKAVLGKKNGAGGISLPNFRLYLEGWDGEGDGRELQEGIYVYLWLIHVEVW